MTPIRHLTDQQLETVSTTLLRRVASKQFDEADREAAIRVIDRIWHEQDRRDRRQARQVTKVMAA